MKTHPIVTAQDTATLGPLRLVCVPAKDEQPDGMTCVPDSPWIRRAKEIKCGLDDLAFRHHEIAVSRAEPRIQHRAASPLLQHVRFPKPRGDQHAPVPPVAVHCGQPATVVRFDATQTDQQVRAVAQISRTSVHGWKGAHTIAADRRAGSEIICTKPQGLLW